MNRILNLYSRIQAQWQWEKTQLTKTQKITRLGAGILVGFVAAEGFRALFS